MVIRDINRTAWGTKLLLTSVLSVLTSFVDCISLCHTLNSQHCFLSLNEKSAAKSYVINKGHEVYE